MKLASRSAIESASSANCGSNALIAGSSYPAALRLLPYPCELRMDDLELGRSGVVGREVGRGREADLGALASMIVATMLKSSQV